MEIQSSASAPLMAQTLQNDSFGAQVVDKTLEYMNSNNNRFGSGSKDADYDFQTKVLSAGFTGKGTTIDIMG